MGLEEGKKEEGKSSNVLRANHEISQCDGPNQSHKHRV